MVTTIQFPNGKSARASELLDGRKMRTVKGGFAPAKPIPADGLEALAAMMCSLSEVANFYSVSVDTVRTRLRNDPAAKAAWQRGRGKAAISLRRKQFEAAQQGNVAMLIFLGKQYCGQTDKGGVVHTDDSIDGDDGDVLAVRWGDEMDTALAELEQELKKLG